MSQDKKNTTEDIFASLMEELNISPESLNADDMESVESKEESVGGEPLDLNPNGSEEQSAPQNLNLSSFTVDNSQATAIAPKQEVEDLLKLDVSVSVSDTSNDLVSSDDSALDGVALDASDESKPFSLDLDSASDNSLEDSIVLDEVVVSQQPIDSSLPVVEDHNLEQIPSLDNVVPLNVPNLDKTEVIADLNQYFENSELDSKTAVAGVVDTNYSQADNERTIAVTGFAQRNSKSDGSDNIKVSVGQVVGGRPSSSGYGAWGSTDSHLAHVENLKIAQEKILELEKENEKLRHQNQELISATEIIKERSDLLTSQVFEYKSDREDLENSFKNELSLVKNQLHKKDLELQKSQMKIEDLDSRLKFDMKKIRIRERELENRLELIRAEKTALVRSKDEQILELRRKIDQMQLEVESYRQKCVDLNKVLETNQESFKRTTRALRLAMANLELQEESKNVLKKVD